MVILNSTISNIIYYTRSYCNYYNNINIYFSQQTLSNIILIKHSRGSVILIKEKYNIFDEKNYIMYWKRPFVVILKPNTFESLYDWKKMFVVILFFFSYHHIGLKKHFIVNITYIYIYI